MSADIVNTMLNIIDDEYPHPVRLNDVRELNLDWATLLKAAIKNRMLFCLAKSTLGKNVLFDPITERALRIIIKEGDEWIRRFHNTLKLIHDSLADQEVTFTVIKTIKFFQDVTFDVDIMLSDSRYTAQINHLFEKAGFKVLKIEGGYELTPLSKEYVTVDIYQDFLFEGKRVISTDFIQQKSRLGYGAGEHFSTPSAEGELLLTVSQINFQLRFLTLQDFLQVTKLIKKNEDDIDWGALFDQVVRHSWKRSFIDTLALIHGLYLQLYGKYLNIPVEPQTNLRCRFPYFFSPCRMVKDDLGILGRSYFSRFFLMKELRYMLGECIALYLKKRIPVYSDWIDLGLLLTKNE